MYTDPAALAAEREAEELKATPMGLRVTYLKAVHFRHPNQWE